jgi:Holliday junction resolvasome RuvABC endonuclease subunit
MGTKRASNLLAQDSKPTFKLLGLDPGFSKFGWGALRVHERYEELLAMGIFETKKEAKKRHVLQSEDSFERTREIAHFLGDKIRTYGPKVVCFEAWSPVRNASAAAKVAFAYGALASQAYGLPTVSPTPQRVKKRLTGRQSASKDDIEAAVLNYLITPHNPYADASYKVVQQFRRDVPKSKRDHAFDAIGVIIASLESDIIRAARQFAA